MIRLNCDCGRIFVIRNVRPGMWKTVCPHCRRHYVFGVAVYTPCSSGRVLAPIDLAIPQDPRGESEVEAQVGTIDPGEAMPKAYRGEWYTKQRVTKSIVLNELESRRILGLPPKDSP